MRRWLTGLVCACLLLGGCGRAENTSPMGGEMMVADESAKQSRMADGAMEMSAEAPEATTAAPASPNTEPVALKSRKIIYSGMIEVQCDALEPAIDQARGVVQQAGGYVSNLQQSGGATSRSAQITFRVPADKFDRLMTSLGQLGTVRERSFSSSDVTDQWVDLDARVRNLKLEEERLLVILAKSGKVTDLLEVERELARVRGDAERIEGQLRRLNDQVSLSTIELELSLPPDKEATVESGPWIMQVLSDAAATFVHLGKALVVLVINLVILLPFILIPVLIVRWIWKKWRRR